VGMRWAWWVARHLALWFDLSGMYWLRKQTLTTESPVEEQQLPRWQGVVSAGLAVGQVTPGR
jgi:hypothetical protein